MDKIQNYEIQKEKVFNKHKGKINWKEDVDWEKFFAEELYECENIEEFINKYGFADDKTDELKKLKDKYKYPNKFINKIKQCTSQNLKELLNNYKRQNKNKEFLWRNRGLTEEIAREIIEDFDCVNIKEGKIHITVSLPLSPFFKVNSEKIFQKLRLKWDKCIGYDEDEREGKIKWPLYPDQNGIFSPDLEERELEKECYDIKAFRGITYNEILTPIYKLNKDKKQIKNIFGTEGSEENNITTKFKEEKCKLKRTLKRDKLQKAIKTLELKETLFKKILGKIRKILLEEDWDIKVRITKGGLANLFFEKELKKNKLYDIKDFAEEKGKLLISPYSKEELIKQRFSTEDREQLLEIGLLRKEQVFTSYLNAAAIWIAYMFLKNGKCEYEKECAKFWKCKELEDPWNVMYKAKASGSIHDTPPLRNYCVTFYLKDVEGIAWGVDKPLSTREHFDCPGDIYKCEKRPECFIRYLGHSLLALSTNTYAIKEDPDRLKRPWFTQKELENFAKRDLSRWRGELCLIDSETILVCTSSDIEMINKEGQEVEYDIYWKSIIKGISLLVSCKTLAMDISRTLFECIRKYRDEPKAAGEILDTLKIISHLLSRARFIATPSNISRARYIREKFEVYIKASGLSEIINNIEKDYDELNEAIHASMGLKLTRDLVPLAFFTLLGTVILVFLELKGMKCNKIPICKTTIIFFVAFGITCLLKNIYKWIKK